MDPPDSFTRASLDNDTNNAAMLETHSMVGLGGPVVKHSSGSGSILKVKHDVQAPPSQSSLLAIEEARRYQEVEKGYKARKAKAAAEGKEAPSLTVDSAFSHGVESTKPQPSSPPATSELGEWEFTAPPKSEGCCVVS